MSYSDLPVTVLGGYLGAGKTTLVNHLLRNAEKRRIAVLVNDFGDIGIDSTLIESQDSNVINLAGGCVCCSFGSDLAACLSEVNERIPRPTHVLIETSGVAHPSTVGATVAICVGMRLDSVVTVVAADQIMGLADDKYVGETVLSQIAEADLVVLSKADLVVPAVEDEVLEWIEKKVPSARIIQSVKGQLPSEVIFDQPPHPDYGLDNAKSISRELSSSMFRKIAEGRSIGKTIGPVGQKATDTFSSLSFSWIDAIDIDQLALVLVDSRWGIVRAKGILLDLTGAPKLVQVVGNRIEITELKTFKPAQLGIVCIGIAKRFDYDLLLSRIELVSRSS